MIRTRVGYAGGSQARPTYYSIGDHSETIEIDYDPALITYEKLLQVFLFNHKPEAKPYSAQYASVIHYHDEAQRVAAEGALAAHAAKIGKTVHTRLQEAGTFTLAEDYHQKFNMRQIAQLEAEFEARYPDLGDLVDSTAAMRANAFAAGYLTPAQLAQEIDGLGLSAAGQESLTKQVDSWAKRGGALICTE